MFDDGGHFQTPREQFDFYCFLVGYPRGPARERFWRETLGKQTGQVKIDPELADYE